MKDKDKYLKKVKRNVITVDQVAKKYLSLVIDEFSPKWHYVLEKFLFHRIVPFFGGNTRVNEIDAVWSGEFRDSLKKSGVGNKTINNVLGIFSKLLKHCARIGVINTIPYIARLPMQEKEIGRRLSPEEIERIFKAAEDEGIHAVLFLGFGRYCGARHSEALRIQWGWID